MYVVERETAVSHMVFHLVSHVIQSLRASVALWLEHYRPSLWVEKSMRWQWAASSGRMAVVLHLPSAQFPPAPNFSSLFCTTWVPPSSRASAGGIHGAQHKTKKKCFSRALWSRHWHWCHAPAQCAWWGGSGRSGSRGKVIAWSQ